ncbi:MAG: hypothetical protein K5744_05090 [Eubacterium sp.]|uniref:Cell division protein FtsL n=1 Tax=Eubacterium cellulosolvens (strain ATCC 43171 / JCM 9499 / 6) TaxID=633697 RepID=I5AVB9_EUBC6|nr:hypothetical protein [Eubacterium sp.]
MARRQSNTARSKARRRVNSTKKRSDRKERIRGYSEEGSAILEWAVDDHDEITESDSVDSRVSVRTRKNHSRAERPRLGHVIITFLLCAAMVVMCIRYLQLRSRLISLNESIAGQETRLREIQEDNEAEYQKVISSVTMEEVKDAALNKLGMHYAAESQIRYYDTDDDCYVRQYESVEE